MRSLAGSTYFVVCLCGYSARPWALFIPNKAQAAVELVSFLQTVRGPKGERPCTLVTDGGEFDSTYFRESLSRLGVNHVIVPPYSSKSNRAERYIRTITEGSRVMLTHSRLPSSFWAEAVNYFVYIITRVPSRRLGGKSPAQLWGLFHPISAGSVCLDASVTWSFRTSYA